MVPSEATETQEEVQKVEAGDVITIDCMNECCEGKPKPTQKTALILEAQDGSNVSLSTPDRLRPSDDNAHLDGNGNIIGANGATFKIVNIDKGAGMKIAELYKRYKPLREKHLAADIGEDEFYAIVERSDPDKRDLLEATMLDSTIEDRYVNVSMAFDILGIQATKEQIVMATGLMHKGSNDSGMPGGLQEALMAAMMGRGL